MFTGLIERRTQIAAAETNQFESEESERQSRFVWLEGNLDFAAIQIGDSIAHNGVCLTVAALQRERQRYAVEVSRTTLAKTNLCHLKNGSFVNIERALRLQDRLHGHYVLGHVDEMIAIQTISANSVIRLGPCTTPEYLVPHGCIALDGVSLTISHIVDRFFEVSLIPHTLQQTTLNTWCVGQKVNVEYDYLLKGFQRFCKLGNL